MPRLGPPEWSITLGDWAGTLACSPDGTMLAVGSLAGDAIIVEAVSGRVVAKLPDHTLGTLAASWSSDSLRLATGGQDGNLRIHARYGCTRSATHLGSWVQTVAWSPGQPVVAAGAGRAVHLGREDGTDWMHSADLASTVTAVTWARDGRRVGAATYGGLTWFDSGRITSSAGTTHHKWKGSLLVAVVSPDDRWACAGAQDASVHVWRLWSGSDLEMSGYPAKIEHLAFRHDSRWLAVGCADGLTVWDFAAKGPEGRAPACGDGHERHIAALAWQPRGDMIVTGGADGRLVLWPSPSRSGQKLDPLDTVNGEEVASMVWRPDGHALVVGRADGTVEYRTVS